MTPEEITIKSLEEQLGETLNAVIRLRIVNSHLQAAIKALEEKGTESVSVGGTAT